MQLPAGLYLFGRVILADLPKGKAPMPTSNLIYIYNVQVTEKIPPYDRLTPDNLLIPPQFTNRMAWTRGYFENVAYRPLQDNDLLAEHCFWDFNRETYRDESGGTREGVREPCGIWGLVSYRFIDDRISEALGIPPVPV
jgi:hypothetical protein